MPSTSPSARTDCPSTASRGDGQQTRYESGQPCRPYAVNLPAQIKQTEPAGEREDIRRGRRRARGRKGEKVRTCARLPAVLPSKSYIDRTPPGQQAPQPAPAEAPSLPTYSPPPFLSLSILLSESLQNPGLFSPVSRRTTPPRPPAWMPPAPGEPSHFRARPVSHETA